MAGNSICRVPGCLAAGSAHSHAVQCAGLWGSCRWPEQHAQQPVAMLQEYCAASPATAFCAAGVR